jgi:8-oxo-dGTP pyrophosphatase MutT (NUDIX family)
MRAGAPVAVTGEVRAAGGVVARQGPAGRPEILLIHRPRYDDWTFPKGKAQPDESDEACALREVEEETGLRCALERELPATRFVDGHGRVKTVRYWLMRPTTGAFAPNKEVDVVKWLPVPEAAALSYVRDRAILERLAG